MKNKGRERKFKARARFGYGVGVGGMKVRGGRRGDNGANELARVWDSIDGWITAPRREGDDYR